MELSKASINNNPPSEGECSSSSIDETKTTKINTSEGINSKLFYTEGYLKFINDCETGKISEGFAIEIEKMLWAKLWSPEFYETKIDHKDSLSIEDIKFSMATFREMKSIAASMDGEQALSSIIKHMNNTNNFSYFGYLQYVNAEKIAEYFALTKQENYQRFSYYSNQIPAESETKFLLNNCIESLKQPINKAKEYEYDLLMQLIDLFWQHNIIITREEIDFLNAYSVVFGDNSEFNETKTSTNEHNDLAKTITESLENVFETTISADEDAELMAALAMSLEM